MNFSNKLVVSGLEVWQWRNAAEKLALAAAIPSFELDWLLQEVAGLDRLSIRLESFKNCAEINLKLSLQELTDLWQQRIENHLPLQYIIGVTSWRHFDLKVSPAVLIPRPETELLIDLVWQAVNAETCQGSWADLGTGSGAIAIGLAEVLTNATIYAVDISSAALDIAQENARRSNFIDRIKFYQGNWFQPLEFLQGQLQGMVSNPPYIPSNIIPSLQPEVAQHEPHLALDGGLDGLNYIRHLVNTAPIYLKSGGIWLIEMMAGQADAVTELLYQQGSYSQIQIFPDLAGIQRFAMAYRI